MLGPVHRNHGGSGAAAGEEIEFLAVRTVGFHLEISQEMEGYREGGKGERGACILPHGVCTSASPETAWMSIMALLRSHLTQDN